MGVWKTFDFTDLLEPPVDKGLPNPERDRWSFGLVLAGTPVGEPQFILNHVTSVVQDVLATITTVTDKLLSASANDHALQCLRLSFRNRVNFLQQVVVPTPQVMAQYQLLDDALDDAVDGALYLLPVSE